MSSIERTSQSSSGGTGILATIGMLTFQVDLATVGRVGKSDDTGFHFACPHPDHKDGVARMAQRYICKGDGSHTSEQDDLPGYREGELDRCREHVDKLANGDEVSTMVMATKEEITAAKVGDLEANEIDFRVHHAWELDLVTLPGRTTHRLRPSLTKKREVRGRDMELYAALVEMVRTCPHLAIVGTMRLRDSRATYRLGVWGNQLVLSEVLLPSDLAPADRVEVEADAGDVRKLRTITESLIEDFDESLHYFDAKTAVAELVARNKAIADGTYEQPDAPAERPAMPDADVIDLTGLLDQMLAASKTAA